MLAERCKRTAGLIVLGGTLLVGLNACDAAEPGLAPSKPGLPSSIRDGLSVDEQVLACATDEATGEVRLDALELEVRRVDFNQDGTPDWLVAGRDACLRNTGATPWWGFLATAPGDDDGPPRIFETRAEDVRLQAGTSSSFVELIASGPGAERLYRYRNGRYSPLLGRSPESAAGRVIDFGTAPQALDVPEDIDQAHVIDSVLGHRRDATITSGVRGSFTQAGVDETLLLLQAGGPRAAHNVQGEQPAELLRYVGDRLQARYRLQGQDGHFIVAAPDVDGDGRQELLLRADAYQMGVSTGAASLLRIDPETVQVLQRFGRVVENACEGPPVSRKRRKAMIHWNGGRLDDPAAYQLDWQDESC